jgi:hypothetical protein
MNIYGIVTSYSMPSSGPCEVMTDVEFVSTPWCAVLNNNESTWCAVLNNNESTLWCCIIIDDLDKWGRDAAKLTTCSTDECESLKRPEQTSFAQETFCPYVSWRPLRHKKDRICCVNFKAHEAFGIPL